MNSIMETVCFACNSIRSYSKQGISFQQILTQVRKQFKQQHLDIKFKSMRSRKLTHEEFYVNAYYDAFEDQQNETPIEVVIHHNFNLEVIWDNKQVTEFLVQIFDAVVHEYRHKRQGKKRCYNDYWTRASDMDVDYLIDPDEIDAYAVSIAIELCRTLGKFRALRHLHRVTLLSRLKVNHCFVSPNLHAYVQHFPNTDRPVLKTLAKKVYIRLQKIDTDHIFQ